MYFLINSTLCFIFQITDNMAFVIYMPNKIQAPAKF
jgi:hypothetical protein